jgi:hypothetical protein
MSQIRISAKDLGTFALKDSCPRCLWIKLRSANKLPYQIFPGIFSSIDSYTKKFICSYFEKYGHFPDWLPSREELTGLTKKLHHSTFNILDQNTDILLSGVPDEIFTLKDGSYFILDYKTAKYTETQDTLLPLYEVQLNAYAYIAEKKGLSPVKNIALAYMEPQTGLTRENVEEVKTEQGFLLPFSGKIVQLNLKPDIILDLLKKARNLYDQPSAPPGKAGCKDCLLLDNLIKILNPN